MKMMMKRTNSQTSQENLPFANADMSGAQGARRSALGDISSMVSNVSSVTSLGGKMVGATTTGASMSARSTGAPFNFAQKFANFTSGCSAGTQQPVAAAAPQEPGHHGVPSSAMMDVDQQGGEGVPAVQAQNKNDIVANSPDATDRKDAENVQCVVEYVADVYQHLRHVEERYLVQPDYMSRQGDINEKMRGILVDWLVEVHLKYKLKPETLFLAVNLIDRFLEKKQVTRKRLQLVGVTGLLIAAKYEEIYPPEVKDFVYITDKAYTKEEVLQMEIAMLNALEFHITCPTPISFLERYERINGCDEVHRQLARYVCELTILDMKFLKYSPSLLAASALFLANKLLRQHPSWPSSLIQNTRYTENLIKGCAKEICEVLESADRASLQAVRKKYAHQKFHSVAKMSW